MVRQTKYTVISTTLSSAHLCRNIEFTNAQNDGASHESYDV